MLTCTHSKCTVHLGTVLGSEGWYGLVYPRGFGEYFAENRVYKRKPDYRKLNLNVLTQCTVLGADVNNTKDEELQGTTPHQLSLTHPTPTPSSESCLFSSFPSKPANLQQ